MLQSIIFNKAYGWTPTKAASWCIARGYRVPKIHETKKFIRIRQHDPVKNVTYRIAKVGDGVEFIMGLK